MLGLRLHCTVFEGILELGMQFRLDTSAVRKDERLSGENEGSDGEWGTLTSEPPLVLLSSVVMAVFVKGNTVEFSWSAFKSDLRAKGGESFNASGPNSGFKV